MKPLDNPLGRYVRSRLHRRLFVWFGLTIVLTGFLVALVSFLVNEWYGPSWRQEVHRVESFVSNRFARVWDQPAERDALAEELARDLELGVRLEDAKGQELLAYGPRCRHQLSVRVRRDGAVLGEAFFCAARHRPGGSWRIAIPLLICGGILWAASGKIARRLARPLAEVARVAEEIGAGHLSSRTHLSCRTPDEVGALAKAINDMAARIERQLNDQRVLLAAVSHELRTPLGHVRILIELMRNSGGDEKTLGEIEKEVLEIDALVGELLASSRVDFTALTVRRLDAIDAGRRALDRAGLDPSLLLLEGRNNGEIAVEADPTLIARALANLIDNARKHGGGVVALRIRTEAGRVAFEVDDGGSGIELGEEEKVFEPFYKGTNGSEHGALGLGLSLVRRIARAHGGTAYATRRPEGGARVGFVLAGVAGDPLDLLSGVP